MITAASGTGLMLPPAFDIRAAVAKAVSTQLAPGKTKALVGIGRMEGRRFVGEVAWVQKIGPNWAVTAGLQASTGKRVSGEVMIAGSW